MECCIIWCQTKQFSFFFKNCPWQLSEKVARQTTSINTFLINEPDTNSLFKLTERDINDLIERILINIFPMNIQI
jgi:hypothetical protein